MSTYETVVPAYPDPTKTLTAAPLPLSAKRFEARRMPVM